MLGNSITYGITVCNEHFELSRLIEKLTPFIRFKDQVLFLSDADNSTADVRYVIDKYIERHKNVEFEIKHVSVPLAKNFSKYKNSLMEFSTCDWIFQIDADEFPTDELLQALPGTLLENSDVEVILVPRINTVRGITQKHVDQWRWNVTKIENKYLTAIHQVSAITPDAIDYLRSLGVKLSRDHDRPSSFMHYYYPVINFPDYQWRIYQNKPNIQWVNPVHEKLSGFSTYAQLPAEIEWCLMHMKDISRQEKQNEFYNTLMNGES